MAEDENKSAPGQEPEEPQTETAEDEEVVAHSAEGEEELPWCGVNQSVE